MAFRLWQARAGSGKGRAEVACGHGGSRAPPLRERRPAGQLRDAGWASVRPPPPPPTPFGNRVSGLLGSVRTVPKGRSRVASPFLRPCVPSEWVRTARLVWKGKCTCEGKKKAFKCEAYLVKRNFTLLVPSVGMINSLPSVWLLGCLAQQFNEGCR